MIIFLYILLLLVSVAFIMIILVQRGRGGGLSGAFGSGGGSSSAFGTKTGDVFTTLTVVIFVIFMVVSIALSFQYKNSSPPNQPREVTRVDTPENPYIVKLQWTDDADNEQGYRVLRDGAVVTPHDLPPNTTTWTDTTAAPGTQHIYEVQVFRGDLKRSSSLQVKIDAPPASKPTTATQSGLVISAPEAGGMQTAASKPATSAPSSSPASAPARPAATAPASTTSTKPSTAPAATTTKP